MYIVQLLNVLLFRSDIEVIRPGLPECGRQLFTENGELLLGRSFPCAALERNTLFQHLHHPRRICDFWFTDQKVDVFRHGHITGYDKLVFLAGLLKNSQKDVTVPGCREKRQSAVAGARDKVPIALAINADESFRHRLILYPTLWASTNLAQHRREIQSQRMAHRAPGKPARCSE